MIPAKRSRILALTREVRRLHARFDVVQELIVRNALLVAVNTRLIGENDRLRERLKAHGELL